MSLRSNNGHEFKLNFDQLTIVVSYDMHVYEHNLAILSTAIGVPLSGCMILCRNITPSMKDK